MGVINDNIFFGPGVKIAKFINTGISLIHSANTVAKWPLDDLKFHYDQYIQQRIILNPSEANRHIHIANDNTVTTLLLIKVTYDLENDDPDTNYITYSFKDDLTKSYNIGKLMVLSGLPENSVQDILVTNPNADCSVVIDVYACIADYTTVTPTTYNLYIDNIEFSNIQTYVMGTSIAIYDSNGYQSTIITLTDITSFTIDSDNDTITILDASSGKIGVNFTSSYNALQGLSALTWLLNSPSSRTLPQPADITAPVFTMNSSNVTIVSGNQVATMSLAANSGNITPVLAAAWCITNITDARDGNISTGAISTVFSRVTVQFASITNTGTYTVTFVATDVAGNSSTEIVILTVTA